MYKFDMKEEKEKGELLPQGWRKFKITSCEEKESKAGNLMFVINLLDEKTEQPETIYAIATKGKRWFLKSILRACGIAAAEDGIYSFEIEDLLKKEIMCKVEHLPDTWVNQLGETVNSVKAKLTLVKPVQETEEDPLPF